MLKFNSNNVHLNTPTQLPLQIWRLSKVRDRLAVYIGDLGIFLNGLAKSPRLIVLNIE